MHPPRGRLPLPRTAIPRTSLTLAFSDQVATCTVHCSGALLLEARDGDALDAALRLRPPRGPARKREDGTSTASRHEGLGTLGEDGETVMHASALASEGGAYGDDYDGGAYDDYGDPAPYDAHGDDGAMQRHPLEAVEGRSQRARGPPGMLPADAAPRKPPVPEYLDPDVADPGQDRPLRRPTRVRRRWGVVG